MGPSTPVQAGAFVVKARETNGRAAASSVDTNTAGLAIGKIGSADRAHHNTTFSHGRSEPNKRLERARAGHSGLSADGAWAKATAALGMTLLAHDTEEADTTGDRAAQLGLAQGPALAKDLCATQAGKTACTARPEQPRCGQCLSTWRIVAASSAAANLATYASAPTDLTCVSLAVPVSDEWITTGIDLKR